MTNPTERRDSELDAFEEGLRDPMKDRILALEAEVKELREEVADRDQALLNHHADITTCPNHVCKFIAGKERTE